MSFFQLRRGRKIVQQILQEDKNKENVAQNIAHEHQNKDIVQNIDSFSSNKLFTSPCTNNDTVQAEEMVINEMNLQSSTSSSSTENSTTVTLMVLNENTCHVEDVMINMSDLNTISPTPLPDTSMSITETIPPTNIDSIRLVSPPIFDISTTSMDEQVTIAGTQQDPNSYNMAEGRQRKRKGDPSTWKKNSNKKLGMEGKAYLGFRKEEQHYIQDVFREERHIKSTCNSKFCEKSKYRHCSQFTGEQRIEIYERFWKLNWGERKAFVCGFVTREEKKQSLTNGAPSRRNGTYKYSLSNGTETYQICRDMFLNTLGIKYRMVQSWVNASSHGIPNTCTDNNARIAATPTQKLQFLIDFFNSLPKMPSHYNRKNSSRLYLEPLFNRVADVYKLYL